MKNQIQMNKKELIIKNDPRKLLEARKFVEEFCRFIGFDEEKIYDIKVACGEALSNSVEHASGNEDGHFIYINMEFVEDKIIILIRDEGKFKQVVKIDEEDPRHRGRGIPFMLALMDLVSINETENGTIVRLEKKIN